MKDKIQFPGRVEGGEIRPNVDRWVEADLREIEGEQIFITLEPIRDRRNLKQNAFYWGVLLKQISEHTGQDSTSLHEYFKALFNNELLILCDKNGVVIGEHIIHKSTTRMSVGSFAEYMIKIEQWAGENLGLSIPESERRG